MSDRYKLSELCLDRALDSIPLGAQTFSKSKAVLPRGVSPYFVKSASGAHFIDVDGNKYIDFVNSLASISIGYCDPDVDFAVSEQMKQGVSFSLSHTIEYEVAELLIELIPCAEAVRFAKNGSDATSAAIRVARATTGRDRVAVCGYHGWHDWYIGATTRNLGVPDVVQSLTHQFRFNDLPSLEAILTEFPGEIAAIILEPMSSTYPSTGFLEAVRSLATKHGALLIFDETVTGFRFSLGGAQKYFDVIPDLATFGKGMANGFPLSAVVGKRRYMDIMEEIFFSGTFGGETLSLAAAKAVITKMRRNNVLEHICCLGVELQRELRSLIEEFDLRRYLAVDGHPSWTFLKFSGDGVTTSEVMKTFYVQEMFKAGIYVLGSHNLSYAHSRDDLKILLKSYRRILEMMSPALRRGSLVSLLDCAPIVPIFRVR